MSSKGYSLFRRGEIWHYRFKVKGCPRVQKSTKERSKAKADLIAAEAFEAARLRARGDEPVPTVAELVGLWLDAHRLTASEAHLSVVEIIGRLHLAGLENLRLFEVTTQAVEEARTAYLETHSMASANTWLTTIRLLFGWAMKRRMIRVREWDVVELKVQKRPRTLLPQADTTEWLEAFDEVSELPMRTVVRLAMGLGLRESEATRARWEWLDVARQTYTPGKTKGKEAKPRPVPEWVMAYLMPLYQRQGWMAPLPHGRPYSRGQFRLKMLEANEVIGLKGLTPHRLRGTYATWLSELGVPIQDIRDTLGQKDERTTMAYLETRMDRVRRAQDEIAARTGMAGRESGAPDPANPRRSEVKP